MERTGLKLTDMGDAQLVELALRGESEAPYFVLYTRYHTGVCAHISRFVGEREEIEDICTQIKNKQNGLALNMFYNPRDKKDICEFVEKLNKEIAITRVEISKTLPDNL